MNSRRMTAGICLLWLAACGGPDGHEPVTPLVELYGTLEPFASNAVYFLMTDRFVDGDPANNQPDQGGEDLGTFDRPVQLDGLPPGNIGYLGGDFRGIADHAGYIAEMGFGALWLTPIVDNPDEAFTGGSPPGGAMFTDQGKTGYHGYWGVNFFEVDEHLESPGFGFADLARTLADDHGIKTVLDIVCNHGSPAYTMPEDQPMYGEIYDAAGTLVADHQNLHPSELDPSNPLHAFYSTSPDLAELGDTDPENPAVLEYFAAAYLQWIGRGAAAFRVDTIRHMPHTFWKSFADRIRTKHPGFFMFGESFAYDAAAIAEHTYDENGGITVLDFPGQAAMNAVFAQGEPYTRLLDYLHLESQVYANPYDLMTFYDNHDMPRMAADAQGFIDAHNWIFTSRGIPVVYYGSESGFRAGAKEHAGNRDYFGPDNLALARQHPIRDALVRVAGIRRHSVALQRGLQLNLAFDQDTAAFLRVYQHAGVSQSALVLLNRGNEPATLSVGEMLNRGQWHDAVTDVVVEVHDAGPDLVLTVAPHGLRVLLFNGPVNNPELASSLERLQSLRLRPQ